MAQGFYLCAITKLMNYGQVKKAVLQLLNQYSIAGTQVPGSYNNQQDYILRIPALVNDAVMEIATTARKIPATLQLGDLPRVELGKEVEYRLPADFYQFVSGSVVRTVDGRVLHTNLYAQKERKYLRVPKDEAGSYEVSYYRYPMLLGDSPADTDELDNEPETHYAIPFYVAAHLVVHDEAFLYQVFYNKYEDKLAKMNSGLSAEVRSVDDSYGFYG